AQMPSELSGPLKLTLPGTPHSGGTDHASFLCYGVPAFRFGGREWDYFTYTWHTNRDTFDKLVFEEVRHNATLIAAMTYLAAEDPERVSRERRDAFPTDAGTGAVMTWPTCRDPERSSPGPGN
ncbi:MAG TPA: M28 family peptidase, partial [Gemmatimonadetes bacterium]|nr:M28 family peptidase [Gemmatimonadota bacterium]